MKLESSSNSRKKVVCLVSGGIDSPVAAWMAIRKGLAPLFRLSRVRQSLLSKLIGGSHPITFGGATSGNAADDLFGEDLLEAVAPE